MPWSSFAYNYLAGGLIFLVGMLVGWRQGQVGLATSRQRRTTLVLVGGFLLVFGMHLALMLAAEAARG
ncbi:MAG: hypothetical protein DRI34_14265 [Deltaproteobacteria bacterium]|nr:MAG: hypothetical protein DRI34_14265 [Deltaproteobacteria bacterium]